MITVALMLWLFGTTDATDSKLPAQLDTFVICASLIGLCIRPWQLVGIWRSAGKALEDNKIWAILSRIIVCVWVLVAFSQLFDLARVSNSLSVLTAIDQAPYKMWRDKSGALHFQGMLTPNSSKPLVAQITGGEGTIFANAILWIDSPGGLFRDAKNVETAIHRNAMTVIVQKECESACTLVLAAAKRRIVFPDAKLGYHAWRMIGGTTEGMSGPLFDNELQDMRDMYQWNGAGPKFIEDATGPQTRTKMYYPSIYTLIQEKLVTEITTDPSGTKSMDAQLWCSHNLKLCSPLAPATWRATP
ncbi:MAG TPA: hypothetical protein VHX92_02105 [Rhizomicrobium sp.]|nr:hypothetical protein [Rhizomicrobium sp.]